MLTLNKIIELMDKQNCNNQKLASALGLNRQAVTDWKAGRSKSYRKYLPQIAEYFDVSVDLLLGNTEEEKNFSESETLSEHDRNLLKAYHAQPEIQVAVDRLLGIEKSGTVLLFAAAQSTDDHPTAFVHKNMSEWKKILEAPETDDPLL